MAESTPAARRGTTAKKATAKKATAKKALSLIHI